MNAPTRPVLRWHGGKYLLADWIVGHFPAHRVYVEPFGGAASVLMRKTRSAAEVYNDLDDQVVGLFRVLQEPAGAARLLELLRLTPFARREFELSYAPTDDPIEAARRLIMRSFMGFGSNAHSSALRGHRSTGFRSNSNRSGTTPAHDWANYPDAVPAMVARIAGVVIESRDAMEVMTRHDGATTLHYVDPPYVHETRSDAHMYRHELDGGGASPIASLPALARRHGGAVRLRHRALRHRALRLAPRHDRSPSRRRPAARRGAVAQSRVRGCARSGRPRAPANAIAGGGQ